MHIATIGLPSSTKTTVGNALTRGHLDTAAFAFGQSEVHSAVVDVPDPRFGRLAGPGWSSPVMTPDTII